MDGRLAWFPFYVNDFLGGTSAMLLAELGAYLSAMLAQWQSGELQAIPDDPARLMRICGGEPFPPAVRAKFEQITIGDRAYLRNTKLAKIWKKQKAVHEAQASAGKQSGKQRAKHQAKLPAQQDKNSELRTQNSELQNTERNGAREILLPVGLNNHPAVVLYWQRFHPEELPSIGSQDRIASDIGTDLVGWARTLDFWEQNGYRLESIGKMLDKYAEDKRKGTNRLTDVTPSGNPRITAPG